MHACLVFFVFLNGGVRPVESPYSKSSILLVSIVKTSAVLLVGWKYI